MTRTRLLAVTGVLCLAATSWAETITVCLDGSCDFDTIQAAIDYASDGDEIVVSPGTYTSEHPGHVVDMKGKAIALRSLDGPEVTFIDGEDTRRGIACFNGETENTVIEGFTIQNGFSVAYDYAGFDAFDGGGMYNRNSSPTLAHCTFTGNTARIPYGRGGGMYNLNSSPTLTDCTFTGNTAGSGGGMSNNWYSSPTLTNCDFVSNEVDEPGVVSYGGGISNNDSSLLLTNCTFLNNIARGGYGGAISFRQWKVLDIMPIVLDCEFEGNQATAQFYGSLGWAGGSGGATHIGSGVARTVMEHCTFIGNSADSSGGALFSAASCGLYDCVFLENVSLGLIPNISNGQGGAVNSLRGIQFYRCELRENFANEDGGGLFQAEGIYGALFSESVVCGNTPDQIVGGWFDKGGNTFTDECPDDTCPADLNGNGSVDGGDVTIVLGDWGLTDSPADLNGDGEVSGADLTIVLAEWGACP